MGSAPAMPTLATVKPPDHRIKNIAGANARKVAAENTEDLMLRMQGHWHQISMFLLRQQQR